MDVEFSLRWVDVNGVSTRVLEAGSGPALVLSNGMTGHLECYARTIRALASDFRVICHDSIGHGFTDKPNERYTLPLYSKQLLGLLNALGIERALLSGESLGAWMSAWFASEHPERVERLVLNTPGNILAKPETIVSGFARMLPGVLSTSLSTRSGCSEANHADIHAPRDSPDRNGRSISSASRRPRRWSE